MPARATSSAELQRLPRATAAARGAAGRRDPRGALAGGVATEEGERAAATEEASALRWGWGGREIGERMRMKLDGQPSAIMTILSFSVY
jgi:hypothetical protein